MSDKLNLDDLNNIAYCLAEELRKQEAIVRDSPMLVTHMAELAVKELKAAGVKIRGQIQEALDTYHSR